MSRYIYVQYLQKTSTEVLKSLPGGVWDLYGAFGWGPEGDQEFMEFDYGSVISSGTSKNDSPLVPRRSRDLFDNFSCEWANYYTDRGVLETVGRVYANDYREFGWYDLGHWIEELEACLLIEHP